MSLFHFQFEAASLLNKHFSHIAFFMLWMAWKKIIILMFKWSVTFHYVLKLTCCILVLCNSMVSSTKRERERESRRIVWHAISLAACRFIANSIQNMIFYFSFIPFQVNINNNFKVMKRPHVHHLPCTPKQQFKNFSFLFNFLSCFYSI